MANVYSFAGKGPSTPGLNSVEEILDELRAGRMVVVMDDEDRGNEGDLARLAGFEPAAVIVEIMNDDGTMARRPDLEAFARSHNLKIGTIADLIRYRLRNERSIERISEQNVQTEFGEFRLFMYEDHVHRDVHLALTHGPISESCVPLVRVHIADTLRDLLGVRGPSHSWTLRAAM